MENNKCPENMERITTPELAEAFIAEQTKALQAQIGDKKYCLHCRAVWTRRSLPRC